LYHISVRIVPAVSVLIACAAILTSCDHPTANGSAKFFVRDFGALPNDAQADGEAIRKCIASAQASGKPAEVVFQVGTYRVDTAPVVGGELVSLPVRGARDLTLRGAKGGTTTLVFTNPSAVGVLFEGCTDVAIKPMCGSAQILLAIAPVASAVKSAASAGANRNPHAFSPNTAMETAVNQYPIGGFS
jgi:hypothetical protein